MGLFILGAAIAYVLNLPLSSVPLADSIPLCRNLCSATVVIVPRSAGVRGPLPSPVIARLIQLQGKSLAYRDSIVFSALIVVWVCFGTTLLSFILAAMASRHIRKYGPENTLIGHKVSDQYEKEGKHHQTENHAEDGGNGHRHA